MLEELILKSILNNHLRNKLDIIKYRTCLKFRKFLLKKRDKEIKVRIKNILLYMPFSHDLPIILKSYPFYSTNIERLSGYLKIKYEDPRAIDIGANIGDTAISIYNSTNSPVLAIECDPNFYYYLEKNTKNFENIKIEKSFVGSNEILDGEVISNHGTSKLNLNKKNLKIKFENIDKILDRNRDFINTKFFKIDTDGYDLKIIMNSLNFLSERKPVIFFEYDPNLIKDHSIVNIDIFKKLLQIGYDKALVYNNFGDYMISIELNNQEILKDINNYFFGRNSKIYCDICVFHKNDNDIFNYIRESERNFFYKNRLVNKL